MALHHVDLGHYRTAARLEGATIAISVQVRVSCASFHLLLTILGSAVNEITGLNSSEIDQIMCLFDYSDDEVAVTTEELASQSIVKDIERSLPNDAASKV